MAKYNKLRRKVEKEVTEELEEAKSFFQKLTKKKLFLFSAGWFLGLTMGFILGTFN